MATDAETALGRVCGSYWDTNLRLWESQALGRALHRLFVPASVGQVWTAKGPQTGPFGLPIGHCISRGF
jgi:hypothetical protein